MSTLQFGSAGEHAELIIIPGVPFRTYHATMRYADGSAYDLTNCTISGIIQRESDLSTIIGISATISLPNQYSWQIPNTALLKPSVRYTWRLVLTTPTDTIPLYSGPVRLNHG